MKETRKIGNLIIREHSKRSSREEANKEKTPVAREHDKKKLTQQKF